MAGKILNYYADGNTSSGFYSFHQSNIVGLDRLFILKGAPGTGKSTLIKKVGLEWLSRGFDIEFMHCSVDNDSVSGVIIPKLKCGIVDGTEPHVIEPKAPGAIEEYVNLGVAWDSKRLIKNKDEIIKIGTQKQEMFQSAYDSFNKAIKIHDEWEKIYIANMDFSKANKLAEELGEIFFADKRLDKKASVRHRFMGAATPAGPVDFINNLTTDVNKRYFLKGRPGSGKSTLLEKLASKAENNGFDVEIYHCGLDSNSLDMVIVREQGIAIFDSTAPHEYFPERENDEIVDIYKRVITPGTDEKYALELQEIIQRYKLHILEGTSFLAKGKILNDELKKYYIEAMDFKIVDYMTDEINTQIAETIIY